MTVTDTLAHKYYLGIDIGGTKVAYGLFNAKKQLIAKSKTPTNIEQVAPRFFDSICDYARVFTNANQVDFDLIRGIGIGVPSFIHFDTGHIMKSGSIPLLQDFPAKEYLGQKFANQIPIVIDNDGNVGALAERRRGAGRDFEHFIFCLVSTGIGSGLIINREVFRGSYGLAGESGHMLVTPFEGDLVLPRGVCGCNNVGCLNSMCSGKMIVHHVKRWIEDGDKTILTDMVGKIGSISAEHIGEAYGQNDLLAIRAIEQMTDYIAIWLYNMYVSLNINCLVFSGGLLNMGDFFFEKMQEKFYQYISRDESVYFLKTQLDSDAGIIGAMELLFDN